MVAGVIGIVLALGNVVSLTSIQRQLLEVVPDGQSAVAEAAAISRSKSYYGIWISAAVFLCGVALTGINRHDRKLERVVGEDSSTSGRK